MPKPRHLWTNYELEYLKQAFECFSSVEIAEALGLHHNQVLAKANQLGLKKSREWVAERARLRTLDPKHGGVATRFQPGLTPWNKGKKGLQIGGTHTRFKPGQRPHTWRPIGHEVIRDGTLYRKVTDGDPRGSRFDFLPVTHIVWCAAHGPVPAGYRVAFKPGMKTLVAEEITLDRLELVTPAEVLRRNTWHSWPPELRDTVRVLNRVKKTIHRAAKAKKETTP